MHVSDDKKKLAQIDDDGIDVTIRYQYDNHLGSASIELDETGAIISYEEYHPFGTTYYRSGRTETETSQKRYKYVGKERDEETGLYYYGFRYYAAWLCRFVSVDPLQFEYPHYTPFQYAGNKPISYIDLDGLEEAPTYLMEDLSARSDATRVDMPRAIPLEQLKTTEPKFNPAYAESNNAQIGPYNPEGFNKDFIERNNDYWERKYNFDENLLAAQQVSPVVFGNPGQPHGAGAYGALKAGLEVQSTLEGGYGLYKGGVKLYSKGLKLFKKAPKVGKGPIKVNEVTTYDEFKSRSVIGDEIEGHEVLQHANLNERGLVTTRLSRDVSKNNPVIALEKATHQEVNAAQRILKPRLQSGVENIKSNVEILKNNPNIPNSAVKKIEKAAIKFNKSLEK